MAKHNDILKTFRGVIASFDITVKDHKEIVSWSSVFLVAVFASVSCLIYARALLEYVFFILWVHSVSKTLPSVKSTEDKLLTFLILCEKC